MTLLIATKHDWLLKGLNSNMALIRMIPSILLLCPLPFGSYHLLIFFVVGLFSRLIFRMFFFIAFLMKMFIQNPLDLWILNILVISTSWISHFMVSNKLHVLGFLALAPYYYN